MLESNLKVYAATFTINSNVESYEYIVAYNEEEAKKTIYDNKLFSGKNISNLEIEEVKIDNGTIL